MENLDLNSQADVFPNLDSYQEFLQAGDDGVNYPLPPRAPAGRGLGRGGARGGRRARSAGSTGGRVQGRGGAVGSRGGRGGPVGEVELVDAVAATTSTIHRKLAPMRMKMKTPRG